MITKQTGKNIVTTHEINSKQEVICLESIAVSGFKSLKQIAVPISPVTVLLGSNSSGKSSIMQSILLASQNLANPKDYRFELNGVAVTLGTYREVVHRGLPENTPLDLKFQFAGIFSSLPEGATSSLTFTLNAPKGGDDLRKSSVPVTACALEIKVPTKKRTRLVSSPRSDTGNNDSSDIANVLSIHGTMQKNSISVFDLAKPGDIRSRMIARTAKISDSVAIEISMNIQPKLQNFSGSYFPMPQFSQNNCQVELYVHLIGCYVWLKSLHLQNSEHESISKLRGGTDQRISRSLSAREDFSRLVARVRKVLSSKAQGVNRYVMDLSQKEIGLILELVELHKKGQLEVETSNFDTLYKELAEKIDFENLTDEGFIKAFYELNKSKYFKVFGDLVFSSLPSVRGMYEPTLERASQLESSLVDYLADSIHYLGPLRAHSLVDQSGWSPRSKLIPFGTKGENLGKVLDSPESKIKANYPLPPRAAEKYRVTDAKVSLQSALNAWISWFELGKSVGVDDQAAWGAHLELDKEKMFQKGTGVSQILPVIALSLTARPGATVMIEQPELHLHPALQQRLGTFFALLSKTGRRFLIETHSEYLVTRLRREVAVGKIEPQDLGLLFVRTKRSKNGGTYTELKKAPVSKSGVVPVWPQGFFDFTNEDKLDIRLAASKSVE
jgi:predicted ATPase